MGIRKVTEEDLESTVLFIGLHSSEIIFLSSMIILISINKVYIYTSPPSHPLAKKKVKMTVQKWWNVDMVMSLKNAHDKTHPQFFRLHLLLFMLAK